MKIDKEKISYWLEQQGKEVVSQHNKRLDGKLGRYIGEGRFEIDLNIPVGFMKNRRSRIHKHYSHLKLK